MVPTIKSWRRPVIALLAASVLIFSSIVSSGSLVPKAEATPMTLPQIPCGRQQLNPGDVVNIFPGNLDDKRPRPNYGDFNIDGTISLRLTAPPSLAASSPPPPASME